VYFLVEKCLFKKFPRLDFWFFWKRAGGHRQSLKKKKINKGQGKKKKQVFVFFILKWLFGN